MLLAPPIFGETTMLSLPLGWFLMERQLGMKRLTWRVVRRGSLGMATTALLSLGQEEVWRFFGFVVVWRWLYFLGIKMGRGFANRVFVRHFPRHFCSEMVNCWSCEYDPLGLNHSSVAGSCFQTKPGHKVEATAANRMGGSEYQANKMKYASWQWDQYTKHN